MWEGFGAYRKEVGHQWWGWVGGAFLGLIGTGLTMFSDVHLSYWAWAFVFMLGVSFAQFKVWQKVWLDLAEKERALAAITDSYAFALALTEVETVISPNNVGYQGRLRLHNSGAYPLKYRVEKFDLWFDGQALANSGKHNGSLVTANGNSTYFSDPFPKLQFNQPKHQIMMEITILYGHPDKHTRRWHRQLMVNITTGPPIGAPWVLSDESETAITV